jgi:hypothetical protein
MSFHRSSINPLPAYHLLPPKVLTFGLIIDTSYTSNLTTIKIVTHHTITHNNSPSHRHVSMYSI